MNLIEEKLRLVEMSVNEVVETLQDRGEGVQLKASEMLRQQQAEIEELKKFNKAILKKGGYPYPAKTLTDEEILALWTQKNNLNGAKDVIEFARAILKKASEK